MQTIRVLAAALLLSLVTAPSVAAEDPLTPDLDDCPDRSLESSILGASVTVNADCTVDIVLFENINCVGPWIGKKEDQVGPIHITTYYCKGPGGDPT